MKDYLIGGLIGGVLVYLFLKPKCQPAAKSGGGNGGIFGQPIIPSVFVQNPVIPPPPPPPKKTPIDIPPPPPPPTDEVPIELPTPRRTPKGGGEGDYRNWAGWVK